MSGFELSAMGTVGTQRQIRHSGAAKRGDGRSAIMQRGYVRTLVLTLALCRFSHNEKGCVLFEMKHSRQACHRQALAHRLQ